MTHDRTASDMVEEIPRHQASAGARQKNGEPFGKALSAVADTETGPPPNPRNDPRREKGTDERREDITREGAKRRATALGRRSPAETSNWRIDA